MKKLMTALAVCAAATLSLADGVPSLNVVGFKADMSVVANFYTMMAIPFQPVGARAVPIAHLFASNTSFTAGENIASADTIKVWNGITYVDYFYSSFIDAWSTDGFEETTDTIPVGGAFWFNRIGPAVSGLTVSGEVIATNISASVVANYFSMVGNPFATAFPIKSITAPNLTAGENIASADTIKVWNGITYVDYFYSSFINAWSTDGFEETSDSIPAGGAFWFNRIGNATTLTLPVPYSL